MSIVKLVFLAIIAIVILNFFNSSDEEFDGAIMLPIDTKVVAFGDSITYGYRVAKEDSYPSQLSKLLQTEVINAGVNGEVTSEALRRLPKILEKYNPKILIICEGGNDIIRRKSLLKAKENIKKMIEIARKKNVHVVLVGVPTMEVLTLSTAQIYYEIAQELNVPLDSSSLENILGDSYLKIDQIHPNAEGYKILANSLANIITETYIPTF
ncbi:arylesterase [Sulfurimonas sp.]|uniref:arylesterase n=1 Tax=Sulfurimonas sp. TaxID=2022749 RepID=UPI002607D6CB|nr:arylesterase [Sulfurimonas sp.]